MAGFWNWVFGWFLDGLPWRELRCESCKVVMGEYRAQRGVVIVGVQCQGCIEKGVVGCFHG